MLGTTAFILFIMLVATANLCLGFAAAVAFGVGPQTWPVLRFKSSAQETSAQQQESHAPEPTAKPVAAHTPAVPPEPPTQIRLTATEIEEPADASEAFSIENVLTQVARGFDMFEAELADWDQRRREVEPDVDYLTNSAIELRGLATSYLEQFQLCLEPLTKLPAFDPPEIAAQAEIRASGKELAAQLSLRCGELGALHFESGDDLTANEQLTTALTQLLTLLRQTRNRLEEPVTVLVRSEGALGGLASTLIEQSQASLLGRLCFEHLWQVAKEGGNSGCLAMLDVDGLTQCNTLHGPLLAKRLLQ
ncbi:MAG TPA: hypothetical protein VL096_09335, partial [Pirellulaceae bacterium]|nr:hypothetical protein [Pirellulaceae bacterium]